MIKEKFERVLLYKKDSSKNKIKLINVDWEEALLNKELVYEPITDDILNYRNMLHLLSDRKLKNITPDGSRIYETVTKYQVTDNDKKELLDILDFLGLGRSMDIFSTTVHGDLGEYLMNIVFLNLFSKEKVNLTIPKLVHKTTGKMPVFGEDNIYFDIANNIIYLGEAKFYKSLSKALYKAKKSIEDHKKNLHNFAFLKNHTNDFKYNDYENFEEIMRKIDEENLINTQTKIKSIVFIMNDDIYNKNDIEKELKKYPMFDGYIIIFPVLDKYEFLNYYLERVSELYSE